MIKDEQLWFYYVGARGDGTQNDPPTCVIPNGMHWNFSVGVAILRRDGFASMTTDAQGELVTRPVVFTGSRLFVNADARFGTLAVEVLDENGKPYAGYSADDCTMLMREDTTKRGYVERWRSCAFRREARPLPVQASRCVALLLLGVCKANRGIRRLSRGGRPGLFITAR